MTDLEERVARVLCWKNGMDPDLTLGGDGENFLWHEYASDASAAIAAVYEWQPIETAPKGIDVILWAVCSTDSRMLINCKLTPNGWEHWRENINDWEVGDWISLDERGWSPTHWMPQPLPQSKKPANKA